jgi:hypothetical protein
MLFIRFINSVVLCSLFLSPLVSFAQVFSVSEVSDGGEINQASQSPLNCFDYYTFGSVSADLVPQVATTTSGASITFTGDVVNENPYPILDGTLYVKIFRRNSETFENGDGNEVVDQFVVEDNITLATKGAFPLTYSWQVPRFLPAGEYYAAHFFTSADRYSLLGLTFTDDVVGNIAPFSVIHAEDVAPVAHLSKPDTTLNGRNHNFAAFPMHFEAGETVTIETVIKNPTSEAKTLPLQWNQYSWDAMHEDNLRHTKTEAITLAPRETKTLSYEVQRQPEGVVYVVATTEDQDVKSILNVRFVRDGIEETRLNFPGLSSFPLVKDAEATLFTCAHSTADPVDGNVITLTLKDRAGATIHQYQYEGNIIGAMSGFGDTFTPLENINYATLTATLTRSGVTIEETTFVYDCEAIDPASCLPESATASFTDFLTKYAMPLILTLAVLLVGIAAFFYMRHRGPTIKSGPPMTTPMTVWMFIFLAAGVFMSHPAVVEAKSTQVSGTYIDPNNPVEIFQGVKMNFEVAYTVDYFADVRNLDTNALLSDGDSIPVGTRIEFIPKLRPVTGSPTTDIYWNFLGDVMGTPYGYWDNPITFCNAVDQVGSGFDFFGAEVRVFTPFIVSRIPEQITHSGVTLSPLGGNRYRIDSGGVLNVNFRYPSTTGDFGYFYTAQGPCRGVTTVTTNIPEGNIPFTFTVTGGNNSPTAPNISGPNTGIVNNTYTFDVSGTDPDGDQLRYGVADATCTNVIEWLPSAGHVNSGTVRQFNRSWPTTGNRTLYVLTEDSNGARSACATHNIDVQPVPPATADLKINGSDGPISVTKNTVINLSWTSANAPSCTKWGGAWGSGQTVGMTGSETTTVTANATYIINCGGTVDTVDVTVVNQPPADPTISPAGNFPYNTDVNFTINGSDPDGDNIYFEIDWDNNGSVDSTTAPAQPSPSTRQAVHRWAAVGGQTFQARTVDASGATSNWKQHNITIDNPPPPTASLEGRVNGGGWDSADQTINPGDTVELRWSSTDATSCTGVGTGFSTGNATAGTDSVTIPSPGTNGTYTVSCTGLGGNTSEDIIITTRQYPNFSRPSITYSTGAFNPVTKLYDSITVPFLTTNNGGSDTLVNAQYRFEFDRGRDGYEHSVNGTINQLAVSATANLSETVSGGGGIPLGNSRIRVTVDSNNDVTESDEGDNVQIHDIAVMPPDPGLSLTADPTQIQNGMSSTIFWTMSYPYSMNCSVFGPAISTHNFDPVTNGPSGNRATGNLTAKSEYTLRCEEPQSGAVFTDTVTVETQGVTEEI